MTEQTKVVTRFAPSPTGFLHIGGARTALFNWLYAKHHSGKMLLHIEDTDQVRSTPQAVQAIIDSLTWLGLDWDGDPISQLSRVDRHKQVANQMLANGSAYRCYCSPRQVDAMREHSRAHGRPFRHRCSCRDLADPLAMTSGIIDPVIRLKALQDGETTVQDLVKGRTVTPNKELDDFVLVRSDGTPTYMLAVVVDDHDMGVTHIIRGADHQTNAAKQTLIYQALGWTVPKMAHIPLIHGPDGAKLSKRHGATGAEAYRAMGYLPQATRKYLARLGWSHGDEEIMSLDDMIKWFGLDAIGQSASRFDFRKLNNLNGHYIRTMDDAELLSHWKVCLAHTDQDDVLDWLSSPMNA
jgi:glutamyl-tRNA synthetase